MVFCHLHRQIILPRDESWAETCSSRQILVPTPFHRHPHLVVWAGASLATVACALLQAIELRLGGQQRRRMRQSLWEAGDNKNITINQRRKGGDGALAKVRGRGPLGGGGLVKEELRRMKIDAKRYRVGWTRLCAGRRKRRGWQHWWPRPMRDPGVGRWALA